MAHPEKRISWTSDSIPTEEVLAQMARRQTRDVCIDDLDVVFQPLVELTDGKLFAVEALVRCRWPEYKNPEVLIETSAEEGSIGRLGRLIREVAFERCKNLPLFINVHPHELSSRWLVRPDDPINFHPYTVYIEVTESATLQYFGLCSGVLREICSRVGARLVIDDFGAGFSNLKRVVDLSPDVIKIDRDLVRGLDTNKRLQILFRSVVRMCKELGARVVAEGVETLEELKAVRDGGADFGQGFFLARPAFPIVSPCWPDGLGGRG